MWWIKPTVKHKNHKFMPAMPALSLILNTILVKALWFIPLKRMANPIRLNQILIMPAHLIAQAHWIHPIDLK